MIKEGNINGERVRGEGDWEEGESEKIRMNCAGIM